MLLTCESPKITTLKTNNHSSKEVNAHTIRCGLSLFVIVGVVVIPWTQQESITPFFLWYDYKKGSMKKVICYLCGGFAAFNLLVIFPALMSGAPANWLSERVICVLIFGGICFLFGKKKEKKSDTSVMTIPENKKSEVNSIKVNENKSKENIGNQHSLFSSPTNEIIAKKLFKIASNAIEEIISVSGKLNEKGLCEAIMFNFNIILNDPVLHQKLSYKAISDDCLVLLYFLIKQQRTDLEKEELTNFINERLDFYSSEYNKLVNEKQYTPQWVYSTFYLFPLEDEPKPYLDILQVMTFQVGLIRMACKIHELLNQLFNEEIL